MRVNLAIDDMGRLQVWPCSFSLGDMTRFRVIHSHETLGLLLSSMQHLLRRSQDEGPLVDVQEIRACKSLMAGCMWVQADKELYRYVSGTEVLPFFGLSWLITWFSHSVNNLRDAARLFDLFLASHPLGPLYVAAVIMKVSSPHPLTTQAEGMSPDSLRHRSLLFIIVLSHIHSSLHDSVIISLHTHIIM